MAAGILPKPGTKHGPCKRCEHIDCRQTRRDAESLCRVCQRPIGYQTRFYRETDPPGRNNLVHAACVEQ